MASKACMSRLQKEYKALLKEPVPHVLARPHPNNLLEWHAVLDGSDDTTFAGGKYWAVVTFPPTYPFKPPSVKMMTPNGRFAPNAKLCMSMTDFHPESWNPLWSVGTILTGLLSFMHDEAQATTGAIVTSSEEKRRLAAGSMASNVKAAAFRKVFPDLVEAFEKGEMDQAKEEEEREKAAAAAAAEPKAAAAAAAAAGPAAAAAGPAARAAGGRGGGGGAGPPPAAPVAPARGGGEFMLLALAVGALAAVAALPLVNSAGGALRWFGL